MKNQLLCGRALGPCALFLLGPALLTGCGGGGSAAPTAAARPAAVTLSGTVQDADGAPVVGDTVVYAPAATAARARRAQDTSAALSAVTDGQGRYTLSVPADLITPGATLTVYDPGGTPVQSQTLTLDPTQPRQTAAVTITAATTPTPPAAPSDPTTGGAPPAPPAPPV